MVFGLRAPLVWRATMASLLVVFLVVGFGKSASAFPDIIITVGDKYEIPGQLNSGITVYVDNFKDTIAAFELWLQLDRPDIIKFQTDTQTIIDTLYWKCNLGAYPNCQHEIAGDSSNYGRIQIDTVLATIGNIDTAGTLTSGWQMMITRSISGTPFDIKVIGLADDLSVPGTKVGIRPQQGGVLFRLRGDVFNIPDDQIDRTAKIKPNADVVEGLFNFSRPNGTAIGIKTIIGPDTNYYRCNAWVPPHPPVNQCLQWVKVPSAPYDSMIIKIDTTGVLDTSKVWLNTGSLTILGGFSCGNVDGEQPPNIDISDLSYLISYLYVGGPIPSPSTLGNTDCSPDGGIDISDLSALIDYLYISLRPLCCATP